MASRLTKLCSKILVSGTAVFIFLSVSTSGDEIAEATRCYWCGPLAEQVHRSQRAPSCDVLNLEQHQTVCDKGYTHCAIVATSPPYAESRLCVKFYQDECYNLYCNSTKTWRMVCACRGDLCNGPHTDRETKAFAVLPRTFGKSNPRNKRSLISGFISVKTKSPAENNTIIIINNKTGYDDTINSMQSDQPMEEQIIVSNATAANNMQKNIEDNIIIEHGTVGNLDNIIKASTKAEDTDDIMLDQQTKTAEEKHIENTEEYKEMTKNVDTTSADMENKYTENGKMDKPTKPIPETAHDIAVKETLVDVTVPTAVKPTSMEIEVAVVKSVTTGTLPPAEALQQNVTPTKAMEVTTIATTVVNTENTHTVETTTMTTMKAITKPKEIHHEMKKNTGARKLAHLTVFLIGFLVHYFL